MNRVGVIEQKDPFETFLERYKTRPASYELYKYLLGPFFKWLETNSERDPTNFDDRDAEAYLNKAKNLRRSSKIQLLTALRRFVNIYRTHMISRDDSRAWQIHAMRIERMKSVNIVIPADKTLSPKQMSLSIEEMDKLMEIASHDKEQFLLFYIYGYFGFRKGEMRKILRVDWDKNELEVMTSKTRVPRMLYFNDVTKRLLKEAIKLDVPRFDEGKVYRKFKELGGLFAGANRVFSPNTMRHTFKTWMKNNVKDDAVVNSLMGHTDKSVPGIYDHVFEEEKRRAMLELHYYNDIKFLKTANT